MKKKKCPIRGEMFVPEQEGQIYCPKCIEDFGIGTDYDPPMWSYDIPLPIPETGPSFELVVKADPGKDSPSIGAGKAGMRDIAVGEKNDQGRIPSAPKGKM